MNKERTSTAEIYFDSEGILHVELFPKTELTLDKVEENFKVIKRILDNDRALVLITSGSGLKFYSDARSYAAMNIAKINRVATAFAVKSFATKLVVNLYIKFNKPTTPTKIFFSEENALKWLKTFVVLPGDEYVKQKNKK